MLFYLIISLFLPVISRSILLTDTETQSTPEILGNKETPVIRGSKETPVPFQDAAEDVKPKGKIKLPACSNVLSSGFALDCAEILRVGYAKNGVAKVWPKSRAIPDAPFNVYCDMETDGGGWTVIQRRGNFSRPQDYFFKNWNEYKIGFGNIEKDFWLGNDNIFALTNQKLYSVRFDLKSVEGEERYALYDAFWIDDEDHQYTLHIKDYSGNAGDSMIEQHDNIKFSARDRNNDNQNLKEICSHLYKGGWWYNKCHHSNLNGLYLNGKHDSFANGINWLSWKGYHESLAATEIKIRPKNFVKTPLTNHKGLCVDAKLMDFAV